MTPTGKSGFLHAIDPATRGSQGTETSTARLRISETFTSRQGEGQLTGVESFFVRTSGCNLRCWFCDTPYASWNPEGEHQSIDALVAQAQQSGTRHVVITGGEPLLPPGVTNLCQSLRDAGFHITIETAGTIDRDAVWDLLSLSPKLASSTPSPTDHPDWSRLHDQRRMPIDIMRRLIDRSPAVQVKFVIDSADDFPECLQVVDDLGVDPADVWIMPQGVTAQAMDAAATWLAPWTESMGYQFCDRMQIRWYGNQRGT